MNSPESLSHTKWECQYHIVWIPKYRKKSLYKELRQHLGLLLRELADQKGCRIEVRSYIRHQEQEDKRIEQLSLF